MPRMPKKVEEREVVYPRVSLVVCGTVEETGVAPSEAAQLRKALSKIVPGLVEYRDPWTAEDAKQFLGWEEEPEGAKWKDGEYHVKDRYGRKVRLTKNPINRQIYPSNYEALVQEHLNRRWRLNGETLSVGRYGSVVDGQHTGVSLVLAQQDVDRNPDRHGRNWPDGTVALSKIVVYGISEESDVVNTVNTARPRGLTDVIYRSGLFAGMPASSQQKASRILDYAVKRLWGRLGVTQKYKTHAEAMDFVARHGTLLEFVRFVMAENTARKKAEDEESATVGDYLPLGYVTALLYLMAASETPYEDYHSEDRPDESLVSWGARKKAEEFWAALPSDPRLGVLRKAIANMNAGPEGWGGRMPEKDAMVVSAWKAFAAGRPVTEETLRIEYTAPNPKTGSVSVAGVSYVGGRAKDGTPVGIDLGDNSERPSPGDDPPDDVVSQVEARKEEVRSGLDYDVPVSWRKKYKSVHVFLVAHPESPGEWNAWDADAEAVAGALGGATRTHPTGRTQWVTDDVEAAVAALNEKGLSAATARKDEDGEWWVEVSRPKKKGA